MRVCERCLADYRLALKLRRADERFIP